MPRTLRVAVSNAVNEINKLVGVSSDPALAQRVVAVRNHFFLLWQQIILFDLDPARPEFDAALSAMERAGQAAIDALNAGGDITAAVQAAEEATGIVEGVLATGTLRTP